MDIKDILKTDLTPIDTSKAWVITCISNVVRFKSRYNLYRKFKHHMEASGANLFTVEVAIGDRPFEVTMDGDPLSLQLRTRTELWHKENMLNIATTRLPPDWKYVLVVDADIQFMRPDWLHESVQQLQTYDVIQLFHMALDIGPHPSLNPVGTNHGFVYCYHNQLANRKIPPLIDHDGKLNPKRFSNPKHKYGIQDKLIYWHPGFAWGWRRQAFERMGGLLDTAILGAGDHHMALSFIERASEGVSGKVTDSYKESVSAWEKLAVKYIRKNIGYVPGVIAHDWHGRKGARQYWDRWKILEQNNFDPIRDLKRDSKGLYQLVDHDDERSVRLRDQIRAYFRQRSEDSDQLD